MELETEAQRGAVFPLNWATSHPLSVCPGGRTGFDHHRALGKQQREADSEVGELQEGFLKEELNSAHKTHCQNTVQM